MDALVPYTFQVLGMALLICALVWVAMPKAGMARATQWLLFAKLVGTFMALHFAALMVVLGGANVVVTGLATYAIGRWLYVPRPT